MDPHRIAELRSIEYHRVIAARLDDVILERARWQARRSVEAGNDYGRRWLELLELPRDELREQLVSDDETMRAMRQSTPFAGAIGPRERWRIHREVRERETA